MTALPEHTWVRTAAGLEALADTLADAPWIALDSESNSMFVYRERVCLLQLNVGGTLWLVDTLALGDADDALAPLAAALGDPDLRVWVHGGGYDVACLKRDYGLALDGLFDSQVAASFLGWPRTGYAAVVEAICEVRLAKQHTQHDWGARPIPDDALAYALDDVTHLPEVGRELEARVRAADLEDEVAVANRAVADAPAHGNAFDPARMWKLKGVREVERERLPVLAALYAWRDQKGRELDYPPGRLIANAPLIQLARRAPTERGALRRLRLRRSFLAQYGDELLATIAAALETPPPVPDRPRKPKPSAAASGRNARLREWRRAEAERREVPMQVVLPPRALDWIATHGAGELDDCPELGPRRVARYGDVLRELSGASQ